MSFAGDIHKFNVKAQGNTSKVLRGTALAMFGQVVQRTPVDTGRLRGNWQVELNNIPRSTVKQTPSGAISQGNAEINRSKANDAIYIINNLPYARVVEYGLYPDGPNTAGGYSRQSPQGMVRVTVAEFRREVEKQARSVK
jgi:hypothetical protein